LIISNDKLSIQVRNAIDVLRSSGVIIDANTINLMSLVDKGKLTDDEAIEIIINDEGLSDIKKPQ
jgi:hypothetical protein